MRNTPTQHWYHYLLWEDWQNGMYGTALRDDISAAAQSLLSDPQAFADTLKQVASDWPIATAQHLSDITRNHQPWCGRAATCFEFGATINETNQAWWNLTPQQRLDANETADMFTYNWRTLHLTGQMGLFG